MLASQFVTYAANTPAAASSKFGLVGLVLMLLGPVIGLVLVTVFGGLAIALIRSLTVRFPKLVSGFDAVRKLLIYETPIGNPDESIASLKDRLGRLDRLCWFMAITIAASASSAITREAAVLASVKVPIAMLGTAFFVLFVGSLFYYSKVVLTISSIFHRAPNKIDLQYILATNSGMLSPFNESRGLSGLAMDLTGFALLICVWWVAFAVGVSLAFSGQVAGGIHLPPMVLWVTVAFGLFALFSTASTMKTVSASKPIYYAKLVVAALSLPAAYSIWRGFAGG
jgi:hypothetical protein